MAPNASNKAKAPRKTRSKGQFSCEFCRVRKLRCDRPLPCTNCVSRGKTCQFQQPQTRDAPTHSIDQNAASAAAVGGTGALSDGQGTNWSDHDYLGKSSASSSNTPGSSATTTTSVNSALLAEIQTLRDQAKNLEARLHAHEQSSGSDSAPRSLSESAGRNGSVAGQLDGTSNVPPQPIVGVGALEPAHLEEVKELVTRLERVAPKKMPRYTDPASQPDDLVFRLTGIAGIRYAPAYIFRGGRQTPNRCIWLPQRQEALVVADSYIKNTGFVHHVIHHPSLLGMVDQVYDQLEKTETASFGGIIFILSVFAASTFAWKGAIAGNVDSSSADLFPSMAEANIQSSYWVKAVFDVLRAAEDGGHPVSLEMVQGIIIVTFVIVNQEGVSLRFRSLTSAAIRLSTHLGLHRSDHPQNQNAPETLQRELGRRVWWYLTATDWLLASRFGGTDEGTYQINPRQMRVNKPRNLNDADLVEGQPWPNRPLEYPTEMSYMLARTRLAELSREMIDRVHHSPGTIRDAKGQSFTDIVALDAEYERFIQDLPPFLTITEQDLDEGSEQVNDSPTVLQAYMINSLVHLGRCKLQLPNLISSRPVKRPHHPAIIYSREIGIMSARHIIRNEARFERSRHPFVNTRLRFLGTHFSVFIASIILVTNELLQLNARRSNEGMQSGQHLVQSPEQRQEDAQLPGKDVVHALQILQKLSGHSVDASRLLEALIQILERHHLSARRALSPVDSRGNTAPPATDSPMTVRMQLTPSLEPLEEMSRTGGVPVLQGNSAMPSSTATSTAIPANLPMQVPMKPTDDAMLSFQTPNGNPFDSYGAPYLDQMMQGLEGLTNLDGLEWDDVFAGFDGSSLF